MSPVTLAEFVEGSPEIGFHICQPAGKAWRTRLSLSVKMFAECARGSVLQMNCPNGISPIGNPGCFPREKPAATESRYPTYGACWVFQCFHNPPNSDMNYRIFNVRTDVNACDCKRGCTDTRKRVCAES